MGDAINCVQVIDGVHIWRAALDDPGWPGPAGLPAEERGRAEQFLREEPARRWVASRWALRRVLAEYLEIAPAAVRLEAADRGKPRLAGGGGPKFNLSHAGGLALVAVAEREVGIDVERIEPERDLIALAGRALPSEDATAVQAAGAGERAAVFYAAWTRHEAKLKCLGTGLSDSTLRSSAAEVAVENLDIAPEYAAAVAVAGAEVGPVDCRSLHAG